MFSVLIEFLCLILFFGGCAHGSEVVSEQKSINSVDINKFYLENLRLEKFKDKGIKSLKKIEEETTFTRYLIEYDSQGLQVSGMMNVPKGGSKYPAVILNHGHYENKKFSVGLGFKDAADIFARNGYVAVGSDYRNNGYSDKGENFFQHMGYLYDVLYLTEAVKELPYVDKEKIGMWGYSLGGWLTLKAAVINKDIKVIALFGSMSSDDKDNYYAMAKWHPEVLKSVNIIIGTPEESPENYAKMSPVNYLKDISTKVIIHHGKKDKSALLEWSEKLEKALVREGKTVEFYIYPLQDHVLQGKAWDKAMERTVIFFNRYLKD